VERIDLFTNGHMAIELTLQAMGLEGEVITTPYTFASTTHAIIRNGLEPVFADIDPETFELDAGKLEGLITEKTKAIAGVHLYGQPFDVDAVKAVADRHGLMLIEDCAQAHGALYKGRKVGGLSDAGCFSFYPGKNLGAFGEGGAVTSRNPEVIRRIQVYKNHGAEKRYYHDVVGYNMRLEGIQGAVLSCKLKHLDTWNARRQEIARMYQQGIHSARIRLQVQPDFASSVYHIMCAEVENREAFLRHMEDRAIGCGIHYPIPCHLQKAYASLGYVRGSLPAAEYHAEHCVSLPMFPELTDEEVGRVMDACNAY
jgi:dTDP-4-amino-4,6-dideoxygalactose transaminase